MDITLPNGAVLRGVPEGTGKWVIAQKAIQNGLARPSDFGLEEASALGSNMQNFWAGAGKAAVDLGRGVRQIGADVGNMVGLVSDETVQGLRSGQDDVNRRDAELMSTKAGIGGNVAGTLATTVLPAGIAMRGVQATAAAPRAAMALRAFVNPSTIRAAAAAGGIQGALQPVGTNQSRTLNTAAGAAFGAAIPAAGRALSAVAQPVGSALKRGGTNAVQVLQRAGVPLDAAQRTGSQFMHRIRSSFSDNPLTAGRAREFADRQLAAFTRGVLRTIGVDADEATRPVIDHAANKIGAVFERVATRAGMQFDSPLSSDLTNVITEANNGLTKDLLAVFNKQIETLADAIDPVSGAINGEKFNTLRSRLGKLSTVAGLGDHARALDDALLDVLERHAPGEAKALQTARAQWRNYRAILPAIDNKADKYIRPRILINQLSTRANQNLSRRGLGGDASKELLELAEAGATILPDFLPNSGTTARAVAQLAIPGAIGAGYGYANEGNLSGALTYGATAAALPIALQRGMQSQGRVGNYLTSGMGGPMRNALMAPRRAPGLLTAQLPAVAGAAFERHSSPVSSR